jgi:hypothetical protein
MAVMTSTGWIPGRFIPKTAALKEPVKQASHIYAEKHFS